ncbi:MAG TPA: ADP-ribosylglycohydrolase family protein, partial [Devosia sp.]|nr:ADP-ribosylglycohydrolase family protein [Devosia sp.]
VVRDKGLDATTADYAAVFLEKKFMLWHANGQARQNLLEGIPPELCGHPVYSPHADDIDFQIECDWIGIVSPGLPQAAQEIALRAGCITNHGDGLYAGVYLAQLYSDAFFVSDPVELVTRGLAAIPADCDYAAMIRDCLAGHAEAPGDWRLSWQRLEDKWNRDLCPWAGSERGRFNIQGHFNGAYIVLALLHGAGDFDRTIEICTRCGQDTDSNVANVGGVLGTIYGFQRLPRQVKDVLAPYMDRDYKHTTLSINSASALSLDLALDNIRRHGGNVTGDTVTIPAATPGWTAPTARSFTDFAFTGAWRAADPALRWTGIWEKSGQQHMAGSERFFFTEEPGAAMEIDFTGTCIYVQGNVRDDAGILEASVDGVPMQRRDLCGPSIWQNSSQMTAVWITGLPDGPHTLRVAVTGEKRAESKGAFIWLGRVAAYRGQVAPLPNDREGFGFRGMKEKLEQA